MKELIRKLKSQARQNAISEKAIRAGSANPDAKPNPAPANPKDGQIWICHDLGGTVWLQWNGEQWVDYVGGR